MQVYSTKSKPCQYLILVSDENQRARVLDSPFKSCVQVWEIPLELFKRTHLYEPDFPISKAAEIMARRAKEVGATEEALNVLRNIITISEGEITVENPPKTNPINTKPTKEKRVKTEQPKAKDTTTSTAPKEKKERRYSAAQMFQDLIMEGKLTDKQIFAKVQEKFGLDDKKAGYVKWYRSFLRKNGKDAPDPKPELNEDKPSVEKTKAKKNDSASTTKE